YITYAKEEEAIRCIQAVHNFVLEGKVLRACFGTTKYCHAWLRNMTCGNPDCLYLHDVGSQEDSFTKDEIISAYTRSRVPQMASSVSQRRAGTVLPPPAEDFSYSAVVSAKHTIKNGTTNTTGQSRLSPPNSSSGRSTLPPATSWGHRDLNTRTTATEVASSQSLSKSKSEAHSNSLSSSSMISNSRLPSSWNDDTSTVLKMTEGRQVSERDSLSKTLKPYRPGIAKETQAVTSLESSLDIDFSTIPSAWNDDEVVASDETSKGSEEKQVVNGKFIPSASSKPTEPGQIGSKSSTSPKNGEAVNSSKQNLADCVPHSAISGSVLKRDDGESRPGYTEVEKLSVGVTSVTLDSKDTVHSMAESQQLGAVPNTSVVVPLSQSLKKEQSHLKLAGLSSSENKDPVLSCQSSSDKHLDWSSELQSCRVASPLNDIWNSSVATDKPHATANTSHISLWSDKEINPTSTSDGRTSGTMLQTRLSSTDNASTMLNGRREGLGPMYTPDMVSEHSGMRNHQHRALDAARNDNIGSFGNAVSGNKDEGSIISDILSFEFDPWDESYSTANNFVKMLNESEKNDALFNAPSWKSKGTSNESRFSFARQDNQRNFQDSSFRNCGSDQNFSLLSQNSHGNSYQNGVAFQSLEEDFSKSNPLAMSDIATAGSSRSKISAPPGFAAPARVPPPGFSSQDGLNPPPGFSSGFSSQDMLNHPHGYPHGFPSQAGSNPPHGFSSQAGSNPPHGFSSQAGSNPSRGFNSGFSSQDGSNNIPPGFSSAFSAGFSSQNGSNQAYGSTFSGLFTSPIPFTSPKPIIISVSHTFVMLGRNSST
uniref:C3H1-type domain-containing protein n=1 Tax=Aegilops tauschii subsp. strangulata TaxID=200361 RepID=A0A453KFC1_AEGTS